MDEAHLAQHLSRRTLHGKRSFKHGLAVDSPLYDASEEDNDESVDEASISGLPSPHIQRGGPSSSPLGPGGAGRPAGNSASNNLVGGMGSQNHNHRPAKQSGVNKVHGAPIQPHDRGLDSPTYDGDVESSTTAAPTSSTRNPHGAHTHALSSSTFATLDSSLPVTSDSETSRASSFFDVAAAANKTPAITPHVISPMVDISVSDAAPSSEVPAHNPAPSTPLRSSRRTLAEGEPQPAAISEDTIDPAALTPKAIQAFVQAALDGTGDVPRNYTPNPPPVGRPIRIYADGVYDIFHFGHALQLRQAKLSFPSVHLLVGVCSDELCAEHKSRTVMNHAERCESVRHCRWVDEIVADAPWVIDQAFLDEHRIDYVAHDEDPYKGSDGSDDVYNYVKQSGHFIPTRRTPGVSTSELLERIVAGYREGDWDAKLVKIGHPELTSRAPSRATSRPGSRLDVKPPGLERLTVDDAAPEP